MIFKNLSATLRRLGATPGYIRQMAIAVDAPWNGIWTPRLIAIARQMALDGYSLSAITDAVRREGGPATWQTVKAMLVRICPEWGWGTH